MNYIIAILVIGLSIFLFKKASGTLKINLINVSSYVFYILMAFEFVGLTLIYLGFRDHYIIGKLNNNNVINIAFIHIQPFGKLRHTELRLFHRETL